jgi:hypothetical protein
MKPVIKREFSSDKVYLDEVSITKIYGGRSSAGTKFAFKKLPDDNVITLTFAELLSNRRYEGMPLKNAVERFIVNKWQIFEFENPQELLDWMARKD